jgi:hypothetical protein
MKSILKSRVFWLAIIQAAIGVLTVYSSAYPDVGTLLVLKSVLDIVLRYGTTTSIEVPQKQSTEDLG